MKRLKLFILFVSNFIFFNGVFAQIVTGDLIVPEFCNAQIKLYQNVGGTPTISNPHTIDLNSLSPSFNCGGSNNAKPNGVALSGNDLFVAITAGCQRVYKFPDYYINPSSSMSNVSQVTNIASDYVGIIFNSAGTELFTTEGSWLNTELVRYSGVNFSTRTVIGNAGATSYFANIAIDNVGNVWVTDYHNNRLVVFDASNLGTTNTYHVLSNYTNTGNLPVANITAGLTTNVNSLLARPEGIAFDSNGNLWLANNDDNSLNNNATLVKITPNLLNSILTASPTFTPNLSHFNSASGVYVYNIPTPMNYFANCFVGAPWHAQLGGLKIDTANGKIYVTEQANNNLLTFDIGTIESMPNDYELLDLDLLTTNAGNGGIFFKENTPPCTNFMDNICSSENLGILDIGGSLFGIMPYDNECSTTEVGEADPTAFNIDNTVWLSFTTPTTQYSDVMVSVTSYSGVGVNGIDAQIAVYKSSDNSCSGVMTEEGSAYNSISFDESLEVGCLAPNTMYFIQIDGSNVSAEGYFTIQVSDVTDVNSNCPTISPTTTEFIKVDQFGYLPNAKKVAVINDPQVGYNSGDSYLLPTLLEVKDWNTNATVFGGPTTLWGAGATHAQSGDIVRWFDFSSLTTAGSYYIYDAVNNTKSYRFEIGESVYNDALKAAMRSYYYQRCGHDKSSTHADIGYSDGTCHISGSFQDNSCRLYNDDPLTAKNLSGGWHDAGDYNKYTNFAWRSVIDLLLAYEETPCVFTDDYNIPESGNGISDLLDEVKYELDWLLKMQNVDGSVLSVVGVKNYTTASPPSADASQRFYGPATTSASFSAAAMFALGAIQFNSIGQTAYANQLQTAAENAYNWGVSNPNVTFYNSGTLAAGEQEVGTYERSVRKMSAAIFLYALTSNTTYKTYVESNYLSIHLLDWWFAYPFETTIQDALLYYAQLSGVTTTVSSNINDRYSYSMNIGNTDNLQSYMNNDDAYRAFLKNANYTWGSNTTKGGQGSMFLNMLFRNLAGISLEHYKGAASGFVHYFHGVNPNTKVYLSNMNNIGAENSVNEMYHSWFTDGSVLWDAVGVSTYGPAPGFVVGGANPSYSLDGCCPSSCGSPALNALCLTNVTPPLSQPIQKSYKDFNDGWPVNSWEITEPGIYSVSSYVKLVGNYVGYMLNLPTSCSFSCPSDLVINNNPIAANTYKAANIITSSGVVSNGTSVTFEAGLSITLQTGFHAEAGSDFVARIVPCTAFAPQITAMQSRKTETIKPTIEKSVGINVSVSPNPTSNFVTIALENNKSDKTSVNIYDVSGRFVEMFYITNKDVYNFEVKNYTKGIYFLHFENEKGKTVQRLVIH